MVYEKHEYYLRKKKKRKKPLKINDFCGKQNRD